MFRNYFVIIIRHFQANKAFVAVNIMGLAAGIALCTLAYNHLAYNLEFDEQFRNTTPNIYRIEKFLHTEGRFSEEAFVTLPLAKMIASMPGVKQMIRFKNSYNNKVSIRVGQKFIKERIYYADSGFFQVFRHKFARGGKAAFKNLTTVFLTEKIAKKYFGNEDPIGKQLTFTYRNGKKKKMVIRGVLKDFNDNTSLRFNLIVRFETYLDVLNVDESDWTHRRTAEIFLEVPEQKNVALIRKRLPDFVNKFNEFNKTRRVDSLTLLPFADISSVSDKVSDRYTNGIISWFFVAMLGTLGVLVLLIACFNYTNTSIALAGTRIKEISLRKVMGSSRNHVIWQFQLEHFIISLSAVLFSFVLYDFIGPIYWSLWTYDSSTFSFSSYKNFGLFLSFILVFATLISGAYPSLYISKLKTADTLRRNLKLKGVGWFTYILLSVQLIITIIGLGLSMVFYNNADYIDKIYKGYSVENIIAVLTDSENDPGIFERFRLKIKAHPGISKVVGTSKHINHSWWSEKTLYHNKEYEALMLPSGYDYLQTMDVRLLQGRFFEKGNSNDTNCIILNEKYVNAANIKDPLRDSILVFDKKFCIIGVVADFMQKGASWKVLPMVMTFTLDDFRVIIVKTKPNMLEKVNEYLEKKWTEVFPDQVYDGFPQQKLVDMEKREFGIMKTVFLCVSFISLILSLIGLYVFINLIINKKDKEVGIRKVLGATVIDIIFLLGKNFFYIFAISSILGSLCGTWLHKLIFEKIYKLDNYVEVTPLPYVIASLAVTLVALFTIAVKVINVANANPVESLRTE